MVRLYRYRLIPLERILEKVKKEDTPTSMKAHTPSKPLVHVFVSSNEKLEYGRCEFHTILEDTTVDEVIKIVQEAIFKAINRGK